MHNGWIIKRVRDILGERVHTEPDDNILAAYAVWHVYGAQDWDCFPSLLDARIRKLAWDYGLIPQTV